MQGADVGPCGQPSVGLVGEGEAGVGSSSKVSTGRIDLTAPGPGL